MNLFSDTFLLFLLISVVIFYLTPPQFRWIPLLLVSYIFYCSSGSKFLPYLLLTTLTTFSGGILMEQISESSKVRRKLIATITKQASNSPEELQQAANAERDRIKRTAKLQQRIVFLTVLLLNFGILAFLKYFNFASDLLCKFTTLLPGTQATEPLHLDLLVPLGISFYTFQAMGYLIDVYGEKYPAERHLGRFALFISFFPQVIQGPIGRYDQLGTQLDKLNIKPTLQIFEDAVLLMLWGYFKKMVIANRLAPMVSGIFSAPDSSGGAFVALGIIGYAFQLYTDFSGGIDIVSGAAELFGIHLAPNFRRPYFSTSLAEFWRRWHISLGSWMRDYIFYPFALSKVMNKISKALKKRSLTLSRLLPVICGNILVFFVVGIWHGPELRYVAWGLYNGVVIAISEILEPVYAHFRIRHQRLVGSRIFGCFQVLRTFFVVCVGFFFDCGKGVIHSLHLIKLTLTDFHISAVTTQSLQKLIGADTNLLVFCIALGISILILCAVSSIQERGCAMRTWLFNRPLPLRWALLIAFIFLFTTFAVTGNNALEGFMYAIF